MKNLIAILLITLLVSCAQRPCADWRNVRDFDKRRFRAQLIKIKRTGEENKYVFVTDTLDTVYRYGYKKMKVGECYPLYQ